MFRETQRLGLILFCIATLSVVSCQEKEGPMEKLGKRIDSAAEEAREGMEEAGEDLKQASEDFEKEFEKS